MTDTPPPPRPASPVRNTAARAAQAGINVIWLVPIIALIVTLGIAWNAYSSRGAVIEVEFADATGVTPGETTLRFREITVGQVESVSFTPDLSRVVVSIRVDKDVAPYIDSEASFWIVRPQVSAQGVTRLDTVLTGAFIEGYWDASISAEQNRFVGQDRPPLIREDTPGTLVTLAMENADGITEGAPVLYRGVQVGRMENIRLADTEDQVIADAFIEAPHDKRLTTSTVFWDTSGFSLSLGASGVSFNVNSLSSVLQGGVAFDTLISGGRPVERGHIYTLQPDEETARNDILASDNAEPLRLAMLIDDSLRGLAKGADVQFQGLRVGQVTDLAVSLDEPRGEIRQVVTMAISPFRLGLADDATPEEALAFLQEAVAEVTRLDGYELKRIMRTGTVATIDNRNWELRDTPIHRLSLARAVALDMESATIAANGFRFRVPYGTLLCVSDKPLHGELKLPGMATDFYRSQVANHLLIGIRAMEKLREMPLERIHSRKLRSFHETAFL